jgi:hypothetical protein
MRPEWIVLPAIPLGRLCPVQSVPAPQRPTDICVDPADGHHHYFDDHMHDLRLISHTRRNVQGHIGFENLPRIRCNLFQQIVACTASFAALVQIHIHRARTLIR